MVITIVMVMQLHDATDDSDERSRIYRIIGHGCSKELIKMALDFSFSVSSLTDGTCVRYVVLLSGQSA